MDRGGPNMLDEIIQDYGAWQSSVSAASVAAGGNPDSGIRKSGSSLRERNRQHAQSQSK